MKSSQVRHLLFVMEFLAGTTLLLAQQAQETKTEGDRPGMDLVWGEKIPMRDGIRLNATVYRPSRQAGPLPTIFTFTPYIGDTYHSRAMYFAEHGYVFALVDVRGRGNSEGSFEPFVHEGKDGCDVVEWLARQPWCDGKVTMWGGSYAGFDQWSVLKEFPPHLATIVPAAAAHAAVDFPFFKNIFTSYIIQWLTYTSGVTGNGNLFGQSSFWIQKFSEMYTNHRPFNELDRIVGNTSTVFQKWLQHPIPDGYWDAMSPTPEDYRKMDLPILTITGHYDGDQAGAMTYYQRHMKYGSPRARDRHYLIIGPWDHAGTRTPAREVGGLVFGEASMVDLNSLHQEWYDWTMKGGPRPEFLKKRVAYYVVGPGAEEWKYADNLEEIGREARTYYLASEGGRANDAFHSGSLSTQKQGESKPDSYTYDPLDTRPAELEKDEIRNSITDQRFALNLFGNGVVYHSEPFTAATEISGYVRLTVWMALDVPDTDFQAALYEILPDGTSVTLTGDMLRARYRESLRQEKLVSPGEVNPYDFTGFTWFSRRISKGSRLRLVLSSPNSIQLEKNYNSGGIVAGESGKDARTAHIRVYHDAGHPSALQIPVVAPTSP
jgi:putative CocE/NonD family hydrolase